VRDHKAAQGVSAPGVWFAERHVYLRSGSESRYVVLSRSLQVGVTIALALLLAGLLAAGYGAIASHLAALEQQREIARLESLVQSAQAAAATRGAVAGTASRVDQPAMQAQIEAISGIEQSDAAQGPAAGSKQGARTAEVEQHLAHAGEQTARLAAQLAAAETTAAALAGGSVPPAQSGADDAAFAALAPLKADGPDGHLQQLRWRLARAATAVALLDRDLAVAQGALAAERARMSPPAAENASELARLREQLRRATARIDQLEGLADVAAPTLAPAPSPPAPR
jgi:hypothetical protein